MKRIILVPVKVVSEANTRECWQAKARRAKKQREAAKLMVLQHCSAMRHTSGRFYITLTRLGVRKLDGDNLQRSLKAIRDGVADALGIDDGSDRIGWHYAQEYGGPKRYAVSVDIEYQEAIHA